MYADQEAPVRLPLGSRGVQGASGTPDLPVRTAPMATGPMVLDEEQRFLTGTGPVSDQRFEPRGPRVRDLVHPGDMGRLRDLELEARARPGRAAVAPLRFVHEEGYRWGEARILDRRRSGEPPTTVGAFRLLRRRDLIIDLTGDEVGFYDARRQLFAPLSTLSAAAAVVCQPERRFDRPAGVAAIMLIDLAGLGATREREGASTAESVLARVAERLALVLRPTDVLARVGADRFGVLFEGLTRLRDIEHLVGRVYHLSTMPAVIDGVSYSTGSRVGIGSDDGAPAGMGVLRKAEIALAAAACKVYGQIEWFRPELLALQGTDTLELADTESDPIDRVAPALG